MANKEAGETYGTKLIENSSDKKTVFWKEVKMVNKGETLK